MGFLFKFTNYIFEYQNIIQRFSLVTKYNYLAFMQLFIEYLSIF